MALFYHHYILRQVVLTELAGVSIYSSSLRNFQKCCFVLWFKVIDIQYTVYNIRGRSTVSLNHFDMNDSMVFLLRKCRVGERRRPPAERRRDCYLCNPFNPDLRCTSLCGVYFVFKGHRREKRAQRRSGLKGLQRLKEFTLRPHSRHHKVTEV